ncbi:hypothetical protein [Salinicoccus kekensis]|uniref:Uncharacterized protein n=1 Tax=Salinicoccus kekensis TaxID=714307 RepID=A0A285UQV8_9STAP|nr:hypothetical protein [Salinicoccus kekensis]SOC44295.1 hypothetical protein SAMN05878391_2272 [Salinicoccus kekensis]
MKNFPSSKDYNYWLIGMVILTIYFATKSLGENEILINYITFAGTIISILLAIVAIIYSYQQTNRSSQNYADTKSLLNSISENVNGIEDLKVGAASSNTDIKNIKENLNAVLYRNVQYINSSENSVEKLIESQKLKESGYQDFHITLIPKIYDFENPVKIENNEYEHYVKHYQDMTGANLAIAFNIHAKENGFGYSFDLSVGEKGMTPDYLKLILGSYKSETLKVFNVSKLIYADVKLIE